MDAEESQDGGKPSAKVIPFATSSAPPDSEPSKETSFEDYLDAIAAAVEGSVYSKTAQADREALENEYNRVINSLESRRCMIKPYQQVIAASVGMAVPETLVTNDKSSALKFQSQCHSGVIMKSVSAGKVKPAGDGGEYIPYNVMTMRVGENDLISASEMEIGCCPHFFQEEIRKDYELRIVVVGDRVMPFRIGSQKRRTTEVDWRKGMHLIEFTRCDIDTGLQAKIKCFMSKIGFFSGSIDIMVDREGRHWFLECNQDGAWGWLDDIASGEIARAFAVEFSNKLDALVLELTDA